MRVTVLASGSGGNATLFESRGTSLLVDAGLGPRALVRALDSCGVRALPHAIVVTHAHRDHVGHAEKLAKKLCVPVHLSSSTARAVGFDPSVDVRIFPARSRFAIGALSVTTVPLPHDAAQVGVIIGDGEDHAAIVTDLGFVPPTLPRALAECDVLLVESNHDLEMLESGPYPWFLKRRIRSPRGHLGNHQTHALLRRLSPRTHTVVLMHLSETNNTPERALESARDAMEKGGGVRRGVRVLLAPPRGALSVLTDDPAIRRPPRQLALFAS